MEIELIETYLYTNNYLLIRNSFKKTQLLCIIIFSGLFTSSVIGQERIYTVANAHAHNNYKHPVPFRTAYPVGFGSIEADIITGMLRTMELILGLPPMSQYDAAATSMWRSFTSKPDFTPFQSVGCNIDLNEVNKVHNSAAGLSAQLDFSEVDKIDDKLFNEILWKGIKGETAQVPAPSRSAFVKIPDEDDDEIKKERR